MRTIKIFLIILALQPLMLYAEAPLKDNEKGTFFNYFTDPSFYIFLLIMVALLSTIAALAHAIHKIPSIKSKAKTRKED
jgi:hypothetical protein